ncbi:MAG: hypothetical protein PVG30_03190 [Gammaproteobacteria bacterium]|jgi:AAA+ ATPase superfamily predicted ATPase
MKPRHYFPLGKAYGQAFCNRVIETNQLIDNIQNGKHTFLVAPRRYGKSSLCEKAIDLIHYPHAKLDFYLAVDEKDVERIIINGTTKLISNSIGSIEKLAQFIKKYARKLKPKLQMEIKGFSLELELENDSHPAENIADSLLLLEKLLQKRNKQAVILLDEFQEIGEMKDGKSIEGAIRHAAQETSNLSVIFSGSNPHLLRTIFEGKRRPLYKLCRKLVLDRIESKDYKKHLNKAAKMMWGKQLEANIFDRIMEKSERHPYYVNYLCDVLWSENKKPPTLKGVDKAWSMVIEEERSDLLKDFFGLSENQRKLMMYIANYGGTSIYSYKISKRMDMPVGSIPRALTALMEKDLLEKVSDKYRFIVPAYKDLLSTS